MNPSAPKSRSALPLGLLFVLVTVGALCLLALGWHASILDRYEFRQLQTALSTFWIARDGWHLAYLTPLFGPPWSIPMEFPFYQVFVATLHNTTGLSIESAGRLISVIMLLACLPALHDLLALTRLPHSRRLIVHMVVLTTPVYLFYGRTFMIETTALCGCVWFLALLRRSLLQPNISWILATTVAASFASLAKITTFIVFGLPAVALVVAAWLSADSRQRLRLAFAAIIPALVSLGLAWWWVRFGDAIKDSNPFTGFLASRELTTWNFGTWALRGDWSFWIHLQETVNGYNLTEGALAITLLCVPFATRTVRIVAAVALAGFFSGPLIFANLYHLHDYYYAANSLLLVGAAGWLLASVWDDAHLPRGTNWLALSLLLTFQLYAYYRGYYSHIRQPAPPAPSLAAIIRDQVPADGIVLIYGYDWNPLLPYYMERRAVMVPGERENENDVLADVLARLPEHAIKAMIVHGDRLRSEKNFGPDRARHFGLDAAPTAQTANDDLYLRAASTLTATENLGHDVKLLRTTVGVNWAENLHAIDLTQLRLNSFTPVPQAILTRYGVSEAEDSSSSILNAHAPSELIFPGSEHPAQLTAIYGLADGSYAPNTKAITDGIVVEVWLETTKGQLQQLFQRQLNPAQNVDDRGPQTLSVSLPANHGPVHLRFGNGPKNDPTNDWAYWQQVRIE